MIDNVALLVFGLLIVYTVVRAIKLDRIRPWFAIDTTAPPKVDPKKKRRNAVQP